MRNAAVILAVLVTSVWSLARAPAKVPDDVLARIRQNEPQSLPKYMTPEEQKLPLPQPDRTRSTPPTGAVHCPAEYEPGEGLFIAWEGYTTILTQMAVGTTTGDPEATVYVVVDSASEQSIASNTLSSAGANMSQVEFIIRATDTVWIRDYGPRFIFEDGIRAIVDHTYNRPRPNDNALSDYISTLWGEPQYDIPLTHGGGNFHLFSNGDAFMTELILTENPGLTEQDVINTYAQYQGVNLTITDPFPTSVDSTQHIDMWMLPVGDDKVIIGEYTFDPPRQITNAVATDMQARGYTVYRTPGWSSGGTHYTYTNAVILNNIVFIPKYNVSQDAQALATFQSALPLHTIQQIDCTSIIGAAGALHCIVMHVPAYDPGPEPIVRVTVPNGGEYWTVGQQYRISWIARDDVDVTSIDIHLSTDGGATFPHTIATGEPDDGTYDWIVPALPSEQCRIKVVAHDADLNTGEDTSDDDFVITATGPQIAYNFTFDSDPGWSTEDLWAWGQPTGSGGEYGNPDPSSGYSDVNVYGYNLYGDYQNNLPERHLTSTALDCTNMANVQLLFWRWLGVEQPAYDHAALRVSNDGVSWSTIWQNSATITDSTWLPQEFDISAVADNQPTIYLRWTMGPTDYSWRYCGWNIDDVQIWAIIESPHDPGDLDCDGDVDFDDINPFVLALNGEAAYYAVFPDCDWLNADCDEDGDVDFDDINPFVALLGQ